MNEQEKFLEGLDNDQTKVVDVLDQPLDGSTPTEKKEETQVEGEGKEGEDEGEDDLGTLKPKNRRERRLVKKLTEERESSIFLAGKLEAQSEAKKSLTEEADYLKSVERIYGTDSTEAQLATDLLKKAIIGARDDAKQQAVEEMRQERLREREEAKAANQELDDFVEDIEDTYGVTMNETHQRGFFQLLGKMSPKDGSGNITSYADPHAVWEIFQEKIQSKGTDNRAKNLSARSMVQSGASKESTLADDSQARFLRENGII